MYVNAVSCDCVFLIVLQSNIFILILLVYTLHEAPYDLVQSVSIQPASHIMLLTSILLANVPFQSVVSFYLAFVCLLWKNWFVISICSFGQLILRKIIEIGATICQILTLKCTKFDFDWGSAPDPTWGDYGTPPDPLAGFQGSCF